MTVKSFFKLVEIQTKVASMLPFAVGTLYVLMRFGDFRLRSFILMLLSLLCIDMATTAINNYMDYKKAVKKHGFGYEKHNAIVRDQLQERPVVATILVLLVLAVSFGILLVLNTDMLVLFLGGISFAAGVLYSTGPVPISRTPFGEIFSGSFMGLLIPFIAAYIHLQSSSLLSISISSSALVISLIWRELLVMLLAFWPLAAGIANIMLANNICDLEDDLANNRHTLPSFLGRVKSVMLWRILYYSSYLTISLLLVFREIGWPALLFLLTILPVEKNIRIFTAHQSKQDTFALAVMNFVIMAAALLVVFIIMTIF